MRRIVLTAVALSCTASVAGADILDLTGMYGNKAGCNFLHNAEMDDDSLLALTAHEYQSYATGCEFLQAAKAKDGSQVATMLCSHEGETFRSIDFMHVVKADEEDAYELFDQAGDAIGRVERCR